MMSLFLNATTPHVEVILEPNEAIKAGQVYCLFIEDNMSKEQFIDMVNDDSLKRNIQHIFLENAWGLNYILNKDNQDILHTKFPDLIILRAFDTTNGEYDRIDLATIFQH